MGLRDRITGLFNRKKDTELAAGNQTSRGQAVPDVNDFGGARTTLPTFSKNGGGAFSALSKKTQTQLSLDERKWSGSNIEDMIDAFIDAHPDMSFAVWNFLRMGNSGYTIKVAKLNSGNDYPQGTKAINELISRLSVPNVTRFEKSRSMNNVITQLLLSTVTRGACSLEMVMASGLTDVAFMAPVDPATIDFKFEGDRYVPYQMNQTIKLDIPNFFYQGLDEKIDDPYGRSPLLSAITVVLFQLQVLNDLKAVVHNQGYPRYDIKVIEEVLLKRMPIHIRNNEAEKQKWLNERIQDIIDAYNELEPDDAFVHYDSTEVGMTSSKGGVAIDPEKLMNAIDSLVMSGLKTLSTILGRRSNGNTESFAKIEAKLYLKGVMAIQDCVAELLSRALTFYLNITGKQGIVTFTFNPVEIRTELEQAQFEQIHLLNVAYKRDQGWIDQDEAAMLAVGHAPVAEPNYEAVNGTAGRIAAANGGGSNNKSSNSGGTPNGTPSGSTDEQSSEGSSE